MGRNREPPVAGRYPVPGLVRQARRIADLSQRQMARRAKVSPSIVGRIEAGELTPSIELLRRLLASAGLYLAVVDADGHVIPPMQDRGDIRDGADRRHRNAPPPPIPDEDRFDWNRLDGE